LVLYFHLSKDCPSYLKSQRILLSPFCFFPL
jgi:hypothetical protein